MGNVIQFPKCGRTVSLFGETNLNSANNWKQYCRELDALHITDSYCFKPRPHQRHALR